MIRIETVNYFPENNDNDFNAKVIYQKNGKSYLAHVYIDFFNQEVFIPKQPKECKALVGLDHAINNKQFPNKFPNK